MGIEVPVPLEVFLCVRVSGLLRGLLEGGDGDHFPGSGFCLLLEHPVENSPKLTSSSPCWAWCRTLRLLDWIPSAWRNWPCRALGLRRVDHSWSSCGVLPVGPGPALDASTVMSFRRRMGRVFDLASEGFPVGYVATRGGRTGRFLAGWRGAPGGGVGGLGGGGSPGPGSGIAHQGTLWRPGGAPVGPQRLD